MKGWIACAFIVATALAAQAGQMAKMAISSAEDYSKTMKDVQMQNMALRKAITGASEADVAAAAAKLETDFKDVQAYWEAKKVDDATTSAKNAVAAAQAISKAAAAHDMAAASAGLPALAATCGSCHMAHRDRQADGTFTIK
jgi:hypothetical protein